MNTHPSVVDLGVNCGALLVRVAGSRRVHVVPRIMEGFSVLWQADAVTCGRPGDWSPFDVDLSRQHCRACMRRYPEALLERAPAAVLSRAWPQEVTA